MLLNTEITVKVTNDGEKNNTEVSTNIKQSYKDVLVSIKMAEKVYTDVFFNFCREKGIKTEEEALELYNKITLEELYNEK